MMNGILENVTNEITKEFKAILKDNLVGVYLHGSATMGCFNPEKSDIDVIVVVNRPMSKQTKKELMDCIVNINNMAPQKGLEMSVVLRSNCKPFIYPTPFELHFSPMHLGWYRSNPDDYVEKMNGEDEDLAAHFTVITQRGKCLVGLPIKEVFGEVPMEYYMDSIWNDVCDAESDIIDNSMYLILNLARVLAYKMEKNVLSKKEGGEWALATLPAIYHETVSLALADYEDGNNHEYDCEMLKDYARFMLEKIKQENYS